MRLGSFPYHLKPFKDASEASKTRYNMLGESTSTLPSQKRPETSTVVARRMFGRALGLNVAPPTRAERQALDEAKSRQRSKKEAL